MTNHELIAYFENKELPETLRLDRACTQYEVKNAVLRNIESMLNGSQDGHAQHRLMLIMSALEKPYNGPEIPRF